MSAPGIVVWTAWASMLAIMLLAAWGFRPASPLGDRALCWIYLSGSFAGCAVIFVLCLFLGVPK
jgi:hypothetical protein